MIKTQTNLNKNQNQKSKETMLGLLTLIPSREVEKVVDEGGVEKRWPNGLLWWWQNSNTAAVRGVMTGWKEEERDCVIYIFFWLA